MKIQGKQVRTLSLALVCTLCLNLIPLQVFAAAWEMKQTAEPNGICEHHPSHTAECGYAEAVPETPCAHVHTEDCWHQEIHCVYEDLSRGEEGSYESVSSSDSTHVCSEATGCVIKTLACQHQHDGECGYVSSSPGHPCEFVCPVCSQAEAPQAVPYYLLLIHSLDDNGTQYGFSEVVVLTAEAFQNGGYDLRQHVLEKDGMAVVSAGCYDPETGDRNEGWTLSPDSFSGGGNPEDGSGYLAAQILIEYQALDGYRPVLRGDSAQAEDPYGIMPLSR